ncbi:hypothetical protein D918_01982 [Trichuris suis]|nr:hypothetical protein D918_01982 [Trichuris suis]
MNRSGHFNELATQIAVPSREKFVSLQRKTVPTVLGETTKGIYLLPESAFYCLLPSCSTERKAYTAMHIGGIVEKYKTHTVILLHCYCCTLLVPSEGKKEKRNYRKEEPGKIGSEGFTQSFEEGLMADDGFLCKFIYGRIRCDNKMFN